MEKLLTRSSAAGPNCAGSLKEEAGWLSGIAEGGGLFCMGILEKLKPSACPLPGPIVVSEEKGALFHDLCLNSVMLIVKESV